MITHSIIQLSQLEGATRFDAEYYQQEYLDVIQKLKAKSHDILGNTAESLVSFGAYALTSYINWQETGIPFIVAENVKEGFIDYESVRYIDEKVDEILKKSRVQEGQVLLAMSGSVGNAAVAVDIPSRLNSNQDIVKITLKKGFSPYFLAAFLNCRYGKMQVLRLPVGSVQQHIFLWQTKTLLVPTIPEGIIKEIEQAYKAGLKELKYSKSYYQQAENLLLEELGLKDFKLDDSLFYSVNLSDTNSAHRFDADYFQPKYDILISKIKEQNIKPLLEIVENVPARFNPKPDENYHYVELSNINSSIGIVDRFSEISGKDAPSRARRLLEAGDVIVSSVEGSFDKVAMVGKENVDSLASTGFFQFRSKTILPEVLLILAKSIIIKMQLQKQTAGTILTAVPNDALKNIFIPLLPDFSQQKIADLVRKSHEARKKSKELLETAKRKVEEMIEN